LEAEFIGVLGRLDEKKVFRVLGYSSLFQYCLEKLKLSKQTAYNFITVARKAKEIPQIKVEIQSGNLTVSKARRIAPVINKNNSSQWLHKAMTLPKKQLEKEVAKVRPQEMIPEKSKYVTDKRLQIQMGVDEEVFEKLQRVKDLLSQKLKKSASLEDALSAMVGLYLEKNDPVIKAKRILGKKRPKNSAPGRVARDQKQNQRRPLSLKIKHEIQLRDQGQCVHEDPSGRRCEQKRWLEIHHWQPVARGGDDQPGNLQLLCFHHHRGLH
jgi:hypothetical protein